MIHLLDENCRKIESNLSQFLTRYRPDCLEDWRRFCEALEALSVVERTKRLDDVATIFLETIYPKVALEKWTTLEHAMDQKVSKDTMQLFYETLPEWHEEVKLEDLK